MHASASCNSSCLPRMMRLAAAMILSVMICGCSWAWLSMLFVIHSVVISYHFINQFARFQRYFRSGQSYRAYALRDQDICRSTMYEDAQPGRAISLHALGNQAAYDAGQYVACARAGEAGITSSIDCPGAVCFGANCACAF